MDSFGLNKNITNGGSATFNKITLGGNIYGGTLPPTSLTTAHVQGDIYIQFDSTASGISGFYTIWWCVTSGTPGTWNNAELISEVALQVASGDPLAAVGTDSNGDLKFYANYDFLLPNAQLTLSTSGVLSLNYVKTTVESVTTPTVPASGTAETNSLGYDVIVDVGGGAVTDITINSQSLSVTGGSFILRDGDSITLTYTTAPTWTWRNL